MKRRVDGASPSRVAKLHALVVQRRDNRLRSGPVRVRVPPWAPFHAPVAQRRGSGFKPRSVSVQIRPGVRPRSSVERVADYESTGRRCKSCRGHHSSCSRSSMYRAPRFERGGWRRKSFRECHFKQGTSTGTASRDCCFAAMRSGFALSDALSRRHSVLTRSCRHRAA